MLRAILDNPTELDRRYIYCDWLQETSDDPKLLRHAQIIYNQLMGNNIFEMMELIEFFQLEFILELITDRAFWITCQRGALLENGFLSEIKVVDSLWLKHGSRLMSEHPIIYVDVRHKNPSSDIRWYRGTQRPLNSNEIIPDIFELLEEGYSVIALQNGVYVKSRRYDTEKDARDDLSNAYIKWAIKQAKSKRIYPK